jgi:hypothetical protein
MTLHEVCFDASHVIYADGLELIAPAIALRQASAA